MKTIRIEKAVLLDALNANLKQYKLDYRETVNNRHDAYVDKIESLLNSIHSGANYDVPASLSFPEVPNHTDTYERVIAMCEMSADEVFELDSHEFDQYVRNQWQWMNNFDLLAKSYIGGKIN